MKKLSSLLVALFALSCTLFTGCKETIDDLKNDLLGPADVWCTMPVEYEKGENKVTLDVTFFWSETGVSANTDGSNKKGLRTDWSDGIKPGLSILVTANINSSSTAADVINGLTSDTFIFKTFPLDEETSLTDDPEGTQTAALKIKGDRSKWTTIYLLKGDLRKENNQDDGLPAALKYGSRQNKLDELTAEDFSWKKLLANYLLQ